ncbi:secreted protein [Rhodopirellula maiorica SM1]|uniref:Secreted protein n=1 Tax=Rhodopirellula maiorica SM1 TaxID=1265738 RepID=M5RV81_9BACT|nr:hypothetical protein [Rhodopirellula maiorica]EMI17854.1 secreted protein [Rhodopirellula maiorica SM1]
MAEYSQQRRLTLTMSAIVLTSIAVSSLAWAADSGSNTKPDRANTPEIDPNLETIAIALVNNQLPELEPLLDRLKANEPAQYHAAIRDLARSAKRLQTAKNRDPEIYEIESKLLQTQMHVKMLAAKLKVRDRQTDRDALREAVATLIQMEMKRGEAEIRYTKQRIERTQRQLAAAEERLEAKQENFDNNLEKTYQQLLRSAGRNKQKKKDAR